MRILYGVVGEGMGHAIRSRVVIDHLINAEGHEVEVVVSGRAHRVLQGYFPEVHKIWGLKMTYKDNEFRMVRSILENAKSMLDGIPTNILRYLEVTRDFKPDCVISDFESWSHLYGIRHRIPIICIDNIQMVARAKHPEEFVKPHERNFALTKGFVKGKLPGCDHYYITTFFYPEKVKDRTTLVPPVLRKEILQAVPSEGEHILVYLTSQSSLTIVDMLKQAQGRFLVYGLRRDITEDLEEGNIVYRPFDEARFIADLASARAVVATGGFTLMSESIYLHKPMLCVPVKSQFEQVLNGYYLENLGYGFSIDELDLASLRHFLGHLESYRDKLSSYEQPQGNGLLFRLLDERLDRVAGQV